uniref:Uncharacterized protein n=1 Tax=Salmo trutta TaxID=8032 RepID=A0A673ZPX6_SALTR
LCSQTQTDPTEPQDMESPHPSVGGPCNPSVGGPCNPSVGGPCSPSVGGPCNPSVGGPCSPSVGGPCSQRIEKANVLPLHPHYSSPPSLSQQ